MWIATIVADFQLDLLALKLFGPTEHIKNGCLIIFIENLLIVIHDHARLTYGVVADKDELYRFSCV